MLVATAPTVELTAAMILGPIVIAFLFWMSRRALTSYQKFGDIGGSEKKRHIRDALLLLTGFYVLEFGVLFLAVH